MTNKPLILLGVVTALAMAGGQANAQTTCPASTTVMTIRGTAGGFSCELDGLTFSNFSFSGTNAGGFNGGNVPGSTPVDFGTDKVTIGAPVSGSGNTSDTTTPFKGSPTFAFNVMADPTAISSIDDATVTVHGILTLGSRTNPSTAQVQAHTTYSTGLMLTGTGRLTSSTGNSVVNIPGIGDFSPSVQMVGVSSVGSVTGTGSGTPFSSNRTVLSQVIDGFSVTPVTPPNGVPEPASLALFGLGLAGLGLARRRPRC